MITNIDWEKCNGLIPAIIQDHQTGQVLMLGYMNQAALTQTITTQWVTFYSRKRQTLWIKGETSGNKLKLKEIILDCDQDSLLVLVNPMGPTCHLETNSCFPLTSPTNWQLLPKLENSIQQRVQDKLADSYTYSLFTSGLDRITQKVGEEAIETVIAALLQDNQNFINELADLLYHILVLLHFKNLSINDVFQVLIERMNHSCK